MNISIAILDSNRDYIERLSEILHQHDELTIYIYTNMQRFESAMETNHFDIVLFDPDISQEKLIFPRIKLPICLYSDEAYNVGLYAEFTKIEKYQRISSIYKEMIREYADKAGYSVGLEQTHTMTLLAVYSPNGGSGKTVVSLTLANQLAALGMSVLFVSLEQLNSSFCIYPKKESGMTALVEAISNEKVNFELKCRGVMQQGANQVSYIEGFERWADYDDTDRDEIAEILRRIHHSGVCDVLVVDMNSFLDSIAKAVMEQADHIIIVGNQGELPRTKMKLFAEQAFTNQNKKKMLQIYNFVENYGENESILDVPVVGMIHNYGNLPLKNMLYAIQKNKEIQVEKIIKK